MNKKLGQEIRRLRQKRKLTLRQLAEAVRVDFSHLAKIETGKTMPSEELLIKLARYFKAPLLFDLAGKDQPRDLLSESLDFEHFTDRGIPVNYVTEQVPISQNITTRQTENGNGLSRYSEYPDVDPFAATMPNSNLLDRNWKEYFDSMGLPADAVFVTPVIRQRIIKSILRKHKYDSELYALQHKLQDILPDIWPKIENIIYYAINAGFAKGEAEGLKYAFELLQATKESKIDWFFGSFFDADTAKALSLFHQLFANAKDKQQIMGFLATYLNMQVDTDRSPSSN